MTVIIDNPTTITPAPTPSKNLHAALIFNYGNSFIEVDLSNDQGAAKRVKVAISPAQQTTLQNVLDAIIKAQTGTVNVNFVPDPPPGG